MEREAVPTRHATLPSAREAHDHPAQEDPRGFGGASWLGRLRSCGRGRLRSLISIWERRTRSSPQTSDVHEASSERTRRTASFSPAASEFCGGRVDAIAGDFDQD